MPYMGKVDVKASDIKRFSVTGSTSATHALSWTAPSEQALIITINGVKQQDGAYTIAGTPTTITLSSPLVATDEMEVIGINDIGTTITPAQNSVDLDKLATTGTPSSSTFLRGDMAWTAVSDVSGLSSVQVFTASGTWTKPAGITKVMVEVQGAGGSGSATGTNYSSGGAGAYVKKILDVSSVTSSTITVGSGGAAIAANGGAGNAGGASSWNDGVNTTLTAGGGTAGTTNGTPAAATIASGGDFNRNGQGGAVTGGKSGSSFLGYSYWSGHSNSAEGGSSYLGAGGGYGYTSYGSGAGGDGIVIVTEYK